MLRIALLLLLIPFTADAADVSTEEIRLDDGSRMLRQSIMVDAPVKDVWRAFTTSEGWMNWAVPYAHVELRIGGLIETSYAPNAKRGDADNIHNRILSFLPYRMLSFRAEQAPPGFEHFELLESLHSVVEFEAVDESRTRVTIYGVGYRQGEDFDELLDFFRQGNAWTFAQLEKRFTEGPVDWSSLRPPRSNNDDEKGDK